MGMIGINLNEVVEKPRLPAGQEFTFAIIKTSLETAKTANKTTGQKEPYIKAELAPLNEGWTDRKVYANWSLSPGALSSDDPCFSIKKFFLVVGHQYNADGTFSTEDLQTIKFVGTVAYKEGSNFANLGSVLRGA